MIVLQKENNKQYRFNVTVEVVKLSDTGANETLGQMFKSLKQLTSVVPEDETEKKFIKDNARMLRTNIKDFGYIAYKLKASLGKHTYWKMFVEFPKAHDIKEFLTSFKTTLQSQRKNKATMAMVNREMYGIQYKLTGGVFTKPGNIIAMQSMESSRNRIRVAKKPMTNNKYNYIGVELELISSLDRTALEKLFCEARLAGSVYLKDDSSIHTEDNNEHSHEITILTKQENYIETITRVCAVLNSKEANCYVNNTCGMHVHFDARHREPKRMFANLVRMLPLLKQMVPAGRVEGSHANNYCFLNTTDVMDQSRHPSRDHRYQAVNPTSYSKYRTIEVRMHSGTTNAAKIINWIALCLYAVDSPIIIDTITTPHVLNSKFDVNSKLMEYIHKRIETFATQRKGCDTRADHFFNNNLDIAV